nr:hypothetical protein [Tanacetum cinerariifolium]
TLLILAKINVPSEHLPFHHYSAVAPPELDQGFEDLESSMMFGRMFLSVLESSSGIRSSKASTTILGTASSSFLDTFLAREDSQLSTLLERDDTSSCR